MLSVWDNYPPLFDIYESKLREKFLKAKAIFFGKKCSFNNFQFTQNLFDFLLRNRKLTFFKRMMAEFLIWVNYPFNYTKSFNCY